LGTACEKCYNRSEPVAIDEVTGLFKDKVIFKQYIPRPPQKKQKEVGVEIYKTMQ
jgi:hypothetical protein